MIHTENITHCLGLSIDKDLNWNEHTQNVLMKINSGIYALSIMSFYCDKQTLRSMYFYYVSYVRSTTDSTVAQLLQQW